MVVPRGQALSHRFPPSSQLPAGRVLRFGDDLILPRWEGMRQQPHALTYRDGVDGVGITIIVAVVAVLPAVAAGHDEDAPKAPATRYHAMLQGGLWRRNRRWSVPLPPKGCCRALPHIGGTSLRAPAQTDTCASPQLPVLGEQSPRALLAGRGRAGKLCPGISIEQPAPTHQDFHGQPCECSGRQPGQPRPLRAVFCPACSVRELRLSQPRPDTEMPEQARCTGSNAANICAGDRPICSLR